MEALAPHERSAGFPTHAREAHGLMTKGLDRWAVAREHRADHSNPHAWRHVETDTAPMNDPSFTAAALAADWRDALGRAAVAMMEADQMKADADALLARHPELRASPDPVGCTCGGVGYGQHLAWCAVIIADRDPSTVTHTTL